MPKKHPWPFRGVCIDSSQLHQEIAQIIGELGAARNAAVAEVMGPPWHQADYRKALAVMLNDMTRPGQPLQRRTRGLFELKSSVGVLGVDRAHRHDIRAMREISDLGGIVAFRELFAAINPDAIEAAKEYGYGEGTAPSEIVRRSGEWSALQDTVKRLVISGQLRRDLSNNAEGDFGWHHGMIFPGSDGIYNLPKNELNRCVLRGQWVLRFMTGDDPTIQDYSKSDQYDLRDLALIRTAGAFQHAREIAGMTISQVVADPDVLASIDNNWDLDFERQLIRDEVAERVRREAFKSGKLDDHEWIARTTKDMHAHWRERLYWRFEKFAGRNADYPDSTFRSVGGHLTAPASFYRAVAAKLGVDAAALSRGRVTALKPLISHPPVFLGECEGSLS
jgi:hypothetical protein